MNEAAAYLFRYKRITDPFFDEFLKVKIKEAKAIGTIPEAVVSDMAQILAGGKRLRGALMCLGYELCRGRNKEIYKTSLFLELFHATLLIHDDVMDKSKTRRGVPTINARHGDHMAINAGDLVFSWTLSLLFSTSLPAERLRRVAELWGSQFSKTVYGQILDISSIRTPSSMRYKTAEYTGVLPLLSGAILAGEDDREKFKALSDYGRNLGMVFQLRDDMLDGTAQKDMRLINQYFEKGIGKIKSMTRNKEQQSLLTSFLELSRRWKK